MLGGEEFRHRYVDCEGDKRDCDSVNPYTRELGSRWKCRRRDSNDENKFELIVLRIQDGS